MTLQARKFLNEITTNNRNSSFRAQNFNKASSLPQNIDCKDAGEKYIAIHLLGGKVKPCGRFEIPIVKS